LVGKNSTNGSFTRAAWAINRDNRCVFGHAILYQIKAPQLYGSGKKLHPKLVNVP